MNDYWDGVFAERTGELSYEACLDEDIKYFRRGYRLIVDGFRSDSRGDFYFAAVQQRGS